MRPRRDMCRLGTWASQPSGIWHRATRRAQEPAVFPRAYVADGRGTRVARARMTSLPVGRHTPAAHAPRRRHQRGMALVMALFTMTTLMLVTTVALDANTGRLTSTATGPEGVRNTVVATVVRSNAPSGSPGAVYLATDSPTNATFDGNAFAVDGNDHNYTGGAGPGAPVPGISTRNDTNTQRTIS